MRARLRVAVFGVLAAGAFAPAAAWAQSNAVEELTVSQSSAVDFTVFVKALFTIKQEGQFKEFNGRIAYDPANPGATRLDLTVYTASVDTHDAGHNEMLRSPDFFDVTQFPTMKFLSTTVSAVRDGTLTVAGDLTIRGVTKHLEVPVAIRGAGPNSGPAGRWFETTFEIDRTEFGLNGSPKYGGINVSVAKKVRIHLAIVAGTRPS